MSWQALLAVVMGCLVLADGAQEEAIKKDFALLQGTWSVTAAERNGQALDRIVGGTLTVKDQEFHIKTKGGTELKGTLTIDPAKKPKTIDLFHQEGALREKTWQGIYEVDGDDLKLCYAEADSNKERPSEFKTTADSALLMVVMKREKK